MPKPSLKSRELSSGEALKRLLPAFPVGIGERHDHLNGRALVLECLEQGLVRNLFLELPEGAQRAVDMILGDPNMTPSLAVVLLDAAASKPSSYNAIHLAHLVLAARDANPAVPVWAAEMNGFTRHNFPARHTAIAQCVANKTNGTGMHGSLLLWGSDHFTSTNGEDDPLWKYIDGLYYFVAVGVPSPSRPRPIPPLPNQTRTPPPLPPRRGTPPPLPPRV